MEPLEERTMLALIGVDSLADGPLDWSDGSTTLREALALAADETNYPGADQITFHPSLGLEATPGRITLTAGQLTLSSDVTLTGPGANSLTVDADGLSGVFYVNGGVTATIDGLTITGGNASSGGGVANYGTLTVDNVLLEGNTAGSGGGIYNSSGRLSITNSTLIGNSATSSGGGIYVGDGLLTLTNSTLAGNTGGSAGAIYSSGALTLANSILWGNSGLELGGSGSFDGWRNLIGINPGFVRNPSDGGDGWLDIASTTTVDEAANNDYGDLRLTERSPAVDYGDLSLLPLDAQDVDRDGNARIFGVAVDCGALEYQQAIPAGRELPSVVVTTTSDTVDLFDDQTSLREALYYADRSDLGMTVSFLATLDGQTLTLGGTMLWLDEPLTIDASALDSLTVDADGRSRVFRVIARDVVLDSLTITGGYADSGAGIYNSGTLTVRNSTLTDNAATNSGGGIYSYYGTLSVTNSTLSDNSAGSGGGIYNASGTVVVTDATLSDNSASSGGGIYASSGTVTVANSTLSGNSARSSGGGIYASSGTVTVANSTLSGNSATSYGGGIYSSSCTLAVTNATFSHNSAGESGGGIYVPLWSSNYVITLSVTNSTFSNNWAGYIGGGIGVDESYVYEYSSTLLDLLSITNSTFSGNGAGYSGGGIGFENYLLEGYPPRYSVTRSGTLSIANSTFSGNWAGTSGGGIFSSSGSLTITNSTLAANSAGSGGAIYSNGALTLANSILWGNSGEELGGFVGLIGTRNLIGVEPGFVRNPSDGGDGWHDDPATTAVDEAANNDYGDLHLAGHSAAIDYGDNYQLPLDKQDLDRDGVTEEPIPVDRESHPRIVGAAVDCGAFEFQSAVPGGRELPSVVVTTASDTVDLYDGQLSLREAIYYAGIDALGMTVTFDATLDGATITLGGTSLWLDKPLTIDASALTALTVAADGSSRVFSAIASDVVLASLTITGGYADNGAGLYSSGSLALWNSTLIGNSATGSGGGIYASSGTLTVVNSIFSGNSAGSSGGGIYGSSGSLTVTNSTFVANTAGSASAIYTSGALTVSNSILWGNSGGEFGGSGSSVGTRDLVGVDPRFVRNPSDGGDGWRDDPSTPAVDEAANNDYGDLHLTDRSPAIDYGDASRLPPDAQDRDHDGVTDEPLPLDREGHPRVFGAAVDCGAFEFQGSPAHLETPSLVVTTASDTFDLLDGQTSLREAIYYAGVGDLGTTVTFAAALDGATIALGGAMLWLDKPLTIDASALPSLTVDAGGKSRVLRVTANDVVLDSLTITGGVADDGGGIYSSGRLTVRNSTLSGNSASSYGGGIYNSSGTLTVANATLSDNRASYGGGIYSSGTLSVTSATLSGNSASIYGGGIYASSSTVTIVSSTLASNSSGDDGGGIYNSGTLSVTNSALSGNSAKDDGAGIYNSGGTVTVTNSTLSGNSTYYWGGGICNSHGGTLTVTNSTFLGNSSSNYDGGGIYSSGTLSVTNAILSGNSAKRFGGGIYSSGTVTVTDSTLSGNSATSHGGGIYNAGPLTLRNSILWRNSNTDLGGSGSVTNARNLIGAEPSFVRNPWNGGDGWRDDPATTTVDESANNDYGDLHLTNDSLAINYGDNSLLPLDTQDLDQDGVTDEPIPLDRDGKPRVFGEVVDCGAFEFQEVVVVRETPSVVVTSASDTLDLFDQQTSLREAIYNAGTGDLGTIVTFDPTLDGATITLGGSALSLDTSLTIDASALQSLTVDADGSSRVFDVTGNHVVLDSLTILGGHSDNGGGIYNSGTLTVRNSTLTGNSASSSGGGIFNAGTLLLTDVTVSENSSASRGGGIYSYGTLTVANSIFSANTGSDGGAICFSGALVLTNSVLSGNSATNAGGGIYSDNATLSVMNSTLAGNSASSGGGIFSDLGTLAVTNSVLSGNSAGSGGGIWNASGVLTVTNATISGNFVLYVGGGIGSYSGTVSVINSMLVGNSAADSGGGIYSSGKLSVTNSTLAGNSGGSTGAITNADLLTLSNSILWQNSGDELGGSGGLTSNSNLIGIDPSFVRNPSDGGDGWRDDPSTTDVDESANNDYGDLHLTKHSLAINAGDNSLLPLDTQDLDRDGVTAEPIPLDRDGSVRVYDVTVDCGAFEFHPRQNPVLPEDVNADGQVTPLDVLLVINYLNANAAQKLLLNPSDSQPPYFDVTGDDQITPQDVLAVIQCLNDQAWPSGEGEAGSEYVLPVVAEAPFATVRSRPLGDRNSSHVDRLELTELVADGQLDDVLSDIAGDVLGQWSPQAATWKTWP